MDKIKIPPEPPTKPGVEEGTDEHKDFEAVQSFEDFEASLHFAGHPYRRLAKVFLAAYHQAAHGKGKARHAKARHANGRPFEEQPMLAAAELMQSADGLLFQAIKKINESRGLPTEPAIHELYGAINYVAGAILYLSRRPT